MKKIINRYLALAITVVMAASMIIPSATGTFAGNLHPDGDAKNVAIETAGEGITMLKNEDNILPLNKQINYPVFGQGSVSHVLGGGGSGEINIASTDVHESVLEGMLQAGLKYDETTLRYYNAGGDPKWYNGGSGTAKAAEIRLTADQVAASKASSGSDTALYVLRRFSAEAADRNSTTTESTTGGMSMTNMGTRAATNYNLTTVEQNNFDLICDEFDNVVVILNVVAVTDLSWMENYPQIKGVVCPYTTGSYGMVALGQILAGDVNPSGKLVDTWAKSLDDYPARAVSTSTFGVTNPVYGEDIYVGYRYFETFAPDRVLYEFGYGMSYTSFDINTFETTVDGDNVTVKVQVSNTGNVAGKEVVQVYYSAPQGVLGKAAKELGAYAKTDELKPGDSQILEISYKTNNMASYDDAGLTGNKSCYVLEAGDYDVYVGNSVKNVEKVNTYNVPEFKVTEVCTEAMTPVANTQGTPFNRLTPALNEDGTFTANVSQEVPYLADLAELEARVQERRDMDLSWVEITGEDQGIQYVDVLNGGTDSETGEYDWYEFMSQIPIADLIQILGNNTNMGTNKTLDDLTEEQRATLLAKYPNPTAAQITVQYYHTLTTVGSAGWFGTRGTNTANLERYGIPSLACIDGPQGMRTTQNPGEDGNTWFQSGTLRAAMWNTDMQTKLCYEIGLEGLENNCDLWLAPGMNIHRDPLCGRNFEYYTEDPLLCGQTAAAETKGIQSAGQAVSLKHFALNQQETSRSGGNSQVSERAIREIYLKGFEIAVKTANPYCIMTSYNRINGSYACSNFDLCYTIARQEWGYTGMLMSDWGGAKDSGSGFGGLTGNALMIRANHDIWMAYGRTINDNGNSGAPAVDTYDSTLYRRMDNDDGVYSYYTKEASIADSKFVCTVADANADTTGILRPLVNGQITMGEIQRSVVNILNLMSKNIYYRTARWDIGLAEYKFDSSADFTTVNYSDITNTTLDKSVLLDMIEEAEALVGSAEYNKTYQFIRDKLDAAIDNAWAVYNSPLSTFDAIIDAWFNLVDAISYLAAHPANVEKLEILVGLANGLDLSKYNVGVAEFQTALTNAEAVLADMFGFQDEADTAYSNLLTAIVNMRYTVDKSMLQALYDEVSGIDTSLYTEDSVMVFMSAMYNAVTVLNDDTATQAAVNSAFGILATAKEDLKPLSDDKATPSTDPSSTPSKADAPNTSSIASAPSAPKTGDANPFIGIVAVLGLAGLMIIISKKRKQSL